VVIEDHALLAVDVLIPTYRRPVPLAVTLTSVMAQTYPRLRVVVSDQTDPDTSLTDPVVQDVVRALRGRGMPVELHHHLPRQGLAEQRQFLLDQAEAPYALLLDDDIILEPDVVARLVRVLRRERCGFAGAGIIGPSFLDDVRPDQQVIEPWQGPVRPEHVRPGTPQWERYRLHNAANVYHVQARLGAVDADPILYKVAWVPACVLYDVAALRAVGGFGFHEELPGDHCGEDVLAQLRVMARFGGCGVLPSGAYHQEVPTTIACRDVDAPQLLSW
jgi:GT2 family glycosyltransferase